MVEVLDRVSDVEVDTLTIPMFDDIETYYGDPDEQRGLECDGFVDSFSNNPILRIRFAIFVSSSKGFSRGKGRPRSLERIPRAPRMVELVQLSFNSYVAFKDGGSKLDRYMPVGKTEEIFMDEVRRLDSGMKEFGLKIKDGSLVPR